jgi:hypothetical protein
VAGIHRDYINAGAQLIETNTYNANRARLEQYHLADKITDINAAGVRLARTEAAARPGVFIAGAVGPLPSLALAQETIDRSPERSQPVSPSRPGPGQCGVDALILKQSAISTNFTRRLAAKTRPTFR